jgi:MtrB/PioB family decaheme-associated outer membrane protein
MRTHSSLMLLAALGVMSMAGAAAAAVDTSAWKCETCPYPKGTAATIDVGVGAVSQDSAQFGNFTGLHRKGAHLALGGTASYRDEGYFADLAATDLGLDTRAINAVSGREGLYSINLGYAEIPRWFADGAATPFIGNGGTDLSLPAGYPAAGTGTMPLPGTLQPIELGYKVQRFDMAGKWVGVEGWVYRVAVRRDVRDGTRPASGSFYANAAQLAKPVDESTDQLEASAAYVGRDLQATLSYQLSNFNNKAESLTWANPFFPVAAGSTRAQLALAPSNQMQQISGSAGIEVTPSARLSGDFSYGRLTQNAAFLDSSLTPSLAAAAGPLPAASLDGQVDTFNAGVRLLVTPAEGVRVNLGYNRDVRDNRTAIRGYRVVEADLSVDPQTRSNTPFTITHDKFKLAADYRGPDNLKLSGGFDQDYRERSYQEVVTTREGTVWARAAAPLAETLSMSLKLAHGDRRTSDYGVSIWFGAPENPLLRKYNLAARKRDNAELRADMALTESVGLGVAVDVADDNYSKSSIGLLKGRSVGLAVDLSVAVSEQTQLTLFAQGEQVTSEQAGSETFAAPDWRATNKDRFDVLGLGIKHAAIVGKLDIGADVSISRSRGDVTVETASTEPLFPAAKTSVDTVKVFATYKLQDKLWLTGSLWHERYSSQDWRLDGVLPATVQNLLSMGAQAPQYNVNVLRVSLRYRF